jgi:3-oxosteroid 1-dehydrogenase
MTTSKELVYDLVVVGSGGGSIPAALVAKAQGKTVLIIEKASLLGGSTCISGGVLWIPNSPAMRRAGVRDDEQQARAYLDACAGKITRASSRARRDAYLSAGPQVAEMFERQGMEFVYIKGYADYYEAERPGAMAEGRAIVGEIFDARKLGAWAKKIRRQAPGTPPIKMDDAADLLLNGRTLRSKLTMARVAWRMLRNKMGADLVGNGTALYARMLEIALRNNVEFWLDTPAVDLIREKGRVTGVIAKKDGTLTNIRARHGVLIDAGGFSHNQRMRQEYQKSPASTEWTFSSPGDTGEVIEMAVKAGAGIESMQHSWWVATSVMPDGNKGMHPADMQKPHCIMVDMSGQRYVNEATDYVAVGNAMYQRNLSVPAIPSWCIIESRHRDRYRWAGAPAGEPPASWLSSGYIKKANTLEELAEKCGIDPQGLRATVTRFNQFAKAGEDLDFGRGRGAWHRFFGDPANKPNSSLGAIEEAPFYAIKIVPGDVGTGGGILTDEHARALTDDGAVIPGLYAVGNSTATVMGDSYPGAGASIAPAFIFGYVAAKHALENMPVDAAAPASRAPAEQIAV